MYARLPFRKYDAIPLLSTGMKGYGVTKAR
jgi:hypothetical protein